MKGFVLVLAVTVALTVVALLPAEANCGTMMTQSRYETISSNVVSASVVTDLPTVNQTLRANVGLYPSMTKVSTTGYNPPLGAGPATADFYWNF